MPTLKITEAGDPDLGLIRAVAAGRAVSIGPGLLDMVQQRCTEARQALRDGRPVYGVNTGMGALSGVRLTEQQQLSCCWPGPRAVRRGWPGPRCGRSSPSGC
jgi:histidine ammonia-lyase